MCRYLLWRNVCAYKCELCNSRRVLIEIFYSNTVHFKTRFHTTTFRRAHRVSSWWINTVRIIHHNGGGGGAFKLKRTLETFLLWSINLLRWNATYYGRRRFCVTARSQCHISNSGKIKRNLSITTVRPVTVTKLRLILAKQSLYWQLKFHEYCAMTLRAQVNGSHLLWNFWNSPFFFFFEKLTQYTWVRRTPKVLLKTIISKGTFDFFDNFGLKYVHIICSRKK